MIRTSIWHRIGTQFGVVSLRPKLADQVTVRRVGDDWQLIHRGDRRTIEITAQEHEVIQLFSGSASIAEIIVTKLSDGGQIELEPVLTLIDKLLAIDFLSEDEHSFHSDLADHLAEIRVQQGLGSGMTREQLEASMAAAMGGSVRPYGGAERDDDDPFAESPAERRDDRVRFLRSVGLLTSLSDSEIELLANAAREEVHAAASDIIIEGDPAERFFIVRSGEVAVSKRDDENRLRRLARVPAGGWFGESGLLSSAPRSATVRAGTRRPVQCYSFDADTFRELIAPHVVEDPHRQLVNRRRIQIADIPVFRNLAESDLDRLVQSIGEVEIPRGEVVFRQGDPGDAFYVVESGAVGVVKDGKPIAKLTAGEFFGETALIFTDHRTATVVATEPTTLFVLQRDDFTTFIRDLLLHRRELMPTVIGRLTSDRPT